MPLTTEQGIRRDPFKGHRYLRESAPRLMLQP